jgi:Cdc6-like AAA superfamily ATPase
MFPFNISEAMASDVTVTGTWEYTKTTVKPNSSANDYKTLIEKIREHGDLVILGQKGTCKTTLLQYLTRELREDQTNRVIVFETFPKWIHEFDSIPYMVISDGDVEPKENLPYMEEDKSIIQWSKDFTILNAKTVLEFLRIHKDAIFLIECEDMEKISAFMTFVIYQIYRKQYQRAKAECLERVNEHFWFMVEESHNLLDSTVIAKKTFNKLRKIQNEFRNLKMHMVCVALRLQDLSPKIRSKMAIMLSRVSLDDYQLKVRNLLRNSMYRDIITELPKGQFVFPENDSLIEVQPFKQNGKPYEWHKPEPKPELKLTFGQKLNFWFQRK